MRNFIEPPVFDKEPYADVDPSQVSGCRSLKKVPTNFLCDKCSREDSNKFAGRTFEFLLVEIMVFVFFLFTMTIYMLKSRCQRVVGENIGPHFEQDYMSLMANKIISRVDMKKEPPFYIGKERMVHIAGFVEIKCIFTQDSYDNIKAEHHVIPDDAEMWIKNNVVGRITKKDLDNERVRETNLQDMMQNTSIINHPESIIEMQIAGLIFFYTLNAQWSEDFGHGLLSSEVDEEAIVNFGQSYADFSLTLLFFMLVEHVLTYIFTYVKKYDILK